MIEVWQDPVKRVLLIVLIVTFITVIIGWIVMFYQAFKERRERKDG